MPPSIGPQDLPPKVIAFVIGLSMLGGMAHYMDRLRRGQLKAHWSIELAGDILYSLATGFTVWYFASASGTSEYISAGMAIVGGHLGARFMFMVQEALVEKAMRSIRGEKHTDQNPEP